MDIPFYPNTNDDTHCYQAVIRMTLKHYWPARDFSWEELEKITDKVDGLWTWPMAGILWLHDNGFEVHSVKPFDYTKFIERGGDYLIDLFGKEVAHEQIIHSDINQGIKYAKQIVKAGLPEPRMPEMSELKKCLDQGYLLICNLNARALKKKDGYTGHFVLLTSYATNGFVLHDPGLPPHKNREVAFSDFERAWAYPNEHAKNYIAVRKTK